MTHRACFAYCRYRYIFYLLCEWKKQWHGVLWKCQIVNDWAFPVFISYTYLLPLSVWAVLRCILIAAIFFLSFIVSCSFAPSNASLLSPNEFAVCVSWMSFDIPVVCAKTSAHTRPHSTGARRVYLLTNITCISPIFHIFCAGWL